MWQLCDEKARLSPKVAVIGWAQEILLSDIQKYYVYFFSFYQDIVLDHRIQLIILEAIP